MEVGLLVLRLVVGLLTPFAAALLIAVAFAVTAVGAGVVGALVVAAAARVRAPDTARPRPAGA